MSKTPSSLLLLQRKQNPEYKRKKKLETDKLNRTRRQQKEKRYKFKRFNIPATHRLEQRVSENHTFQSIVLGTQ